MLTDEILTQLKDAYARTGRWMERIEQAETPEKQKVFLQILRSEADLISKTARDWGFL